MRGGGRDPPKRASPLCLLFAVQAVLFVGVTLAAFTMFTTSRLEHAETARELQRLREERERLEDALEAALRAANGTARGAVEAAVGESTLLALRGRCASGTLAYWTLEICPFRSARQYHAAGTGGAGADGAAETYQLGRYAPGTGALRRDGAHELHHGDACAGGKRRRTSVTFACGAPAEGELTLLSVSELRECEYAATLGTRRACSPGETARAADAELGGPATATATGLLRSARSAFVGAGATARAAPVASKHSGLPPAGTEAAAAKAAAVVEAFSHSWAGYVAFAWGKDEFQPVSRRAKPDWIGLGLTTVDSLSTLHLMGLQAEFKQAVAWIGEHVSAAHSLPRAVSFFETTIRCLGGLLSAYELGGASEPALLAKAIEIGDALLRAFATPSGLPYAQINLHSGQGSIASWTKGNLLLAEVGTVQLEFFKLAQLSGSHAYYDKAAAVFALLDKAHPRRPPLGTSGGGRLWPLYISPADGSCVGSSVSFGAMGDSFYEYTLKTYLLVGRKEPAYLAMYRDSVQGLRDSLVATSQPDGRVYVGELVNGKPVAKMDHLACFLPGLLALGAMRLRADEPALADADLALAVQLCSTCWDMYAKQTTGVAPEFVKFEPGRGGMFNGQNHNLLRPETAESLFLLWRATKDPIYRERGWAMFLAFDRWCRVPTGGFAGLRDVTSANPAKDDTMQSFWLAETLKYLFLLFKDDDALDLERWVLTTEAHPIRVMDEPPTEDAIRRWKAQAVAGRQS